MGTLQQSAALVDRALVTLCGELPESLGLYNTARDQFTISAMRPVAMLEKLQPESRKHIIIRDWMKTYEAGQDQPLSTEISFDSLRQVVKKERKESARLAREANKALESVMLPSSPATSEKKKKKDKKDKTKKMKEQTREEKNDKSKAANGAKKAQTRDTVASKSKSTKKNDSNKALTLKAKKRRVDEIEVEDSDEESASSFNSSSESESSSEESESDSDSDTEEETKSSKNKGKSKKTASNLPPMEEILSSDADEEPNDMFDTEDPDVYEVECILDKKKGGFGQPDMYQIKWVGYDEPTWEPATNVSKDLIDEYEGQAVRENEYVVEELRDRKSARDEKTRLKTFKYLVKWVGYDDLTWEPAENLPHNLRRKFDQKFEARKKRKTR